MTRHWAAGTGLLMIWALTIAATMATNRLGAQQDQSGWTIPPTAAEEKNPLPANDTVLANGRKFFAAKCQRCHGPAGKGDGPDADPKHRGHMDLTSAANAARNPDGVVFHKIWNGRSNPRMPAFKEELAREQVWAVVAFVQSLRVQK
ncbi:MAG TPA: c-type cytochrome [Vicinamibacterales bacterium]|nr:c-type cytochrome [Vicinamibacterales bacterium]